MCIPCYRCLKTAYVRKTASNHAKESRIPPCTRVEDGVTFGNEGVTFGNEGVTFPAQ